MRYAPCLVVMLSAAPAAAEPPEPIVVACSQAFDANGSMEYDTNALQGKQVVNLLYFTTRGGTISGEMGAVRSTGNCIVEVVPVPDSQITAKPVPEIRRAMVLPLAQPSRSSQLDMIRRKQCADAARLLSGRQLGVDDIPASCMGG